MPKQTLANKRDFVKGSSKVSSLIGQVRDMSFQQSQINDDLRESLNHAQSILSRCEAFRRESGRR